MDYIAAPKTWLAAITKSLVLEHFDAYTIIYDHKPVAVEIYGCIKFREAIEKVSTFDKRWIKTRVREDLQQAF